MQKSVCHNSSGLDKGSIFFFLFFLFSELEADNSLLHYSQNYNIRKETWFLRHIFIKYIYNKIWILFHWGNTSKLQEPKCINMWHYVTATLLIYSSNNYLLSNASINVHKQDKQDNKETRNILGLLYWSILYRELYSWHKSWEDK